MSPLRSWKFGAGMSEDVVSTGDRKRSSRKELLLDINGKLWSNSSHVSRDCIVVASLFTNFEIVRHGLTISDNLLGNLLNTEW